MPRELSLAEIFQLGYYWETKILLTAVKLDLFSTLNDQGWTTSELAGKLNLNQPALRLLLNALVAMRIVKKDEGRFRNTAVAQKHLVRTKKDYIGHLLLLHDSEWMNWGKLDETVRTGRSPVQKHVFETDPEMGANVLAVLHRIGRESGPSFAKRLDLKGAKRLLDVGGGAGTNAIAFCQEYPDLLATVFDLPQTLTLTRKIVQEAGLENRIELASGNFNKDPFDGWYDVALMSDILHYQSGETNSALVGKIYDHLTKNGRLIIKDRFLDESGTSPAWTTAFAVHIMLNTEKGQCFTAQEAMGWMTRAGFQSVSELEHCAIIQGTKELKEINQKNG